MAHRKLLAAGAALDLVAVLGCLVLPVYSGDDGTGSAGSATLLTVNGGWALVPLGLFLGLGLLAWLAPWPLVRLLAVLAHGGLTVLALLSIGVFFLPAAALLFAGAVLEMVRTPAQPASVPGRA